MLRFLSILIFLVVPFLLSAQFPPAAASVGELEFGLGIPDNQIVSLGDSGVAILTFEKPIRDGEGIRLINWKLLIWLILWK